MFKDQLVHEVQEIVATSATLRDVYTEEQDAPVSYVAVFTHDDEVYAQYLGLMEIFGALVKETPTGNIFIVPSIITVAGPLRVVKIRKPDSTHPERGDADFSLKNYEAFKARHLQDKHFSIIFRQDFEMIELIDQTFNVRAYFSNPPVEEHEGIREALRGFK